MKIMESNSIEEKITINKSKGSSRKDGVNEPQ